MQNTVFLSLVWPTLGGNCALRTSGPTGLCIGLSVYESYADSKGSYEEREEDKRVRREKLMADEGENCKEYEAYYGAECEDSKWYDLFELRALSYWTAKKKKAFCCKDQPKDWTCETDEDDGEKRCISHKLIEEANAEAKRVKDDEERVKEEERKEKERETKHAEKKKILRAQGCEKPRSSCNADTTLVKVYYNGVSKDWCCPSQEASTLAGCNCDNFLFHQNYEYGDGRGYCSC